MTITKWSNERRISGGKYWRWVRIKAEQRFPRKIRGDDGWRRQKEKK
jgi:hypothetical protein